MQQKKYIYSAKPLVAEDICFHYGGKQVLGDISVTVRPGHVTGLLGPNGSGKTTLLELFGGLHRAVSGQIYYGGQDVFSMSAGKRARHIACVPQRVEVPFALHCSTLVLMGRYAQNKAWFGLKTFGNKDRAIAREAMARVGVAGLWDRPVDEISGGELQRVLFARALAQKTPVFLLDEPTASMDVAGTILLFDLLKEIAGQGRSVLVAMHDINLAALYCDFLYVLKKGAIAASGSIEDIFHADTLEKIYETEIMVSAHPGTGVAQVHYVPGTSCFRF